MKNIKPFFGFIPAAIVIIPMAVAVTRQALFYSGCMDCIGYVFVAMFAFIAGGVLNLIYLIFVFMNYKKYFTSQTGWQLITARTGFIISLLMLLIQALITLSIILKNIYMEV